MVGMRENRKVAKNAVWHRNGARMCIRCIQRFQCHTATHYEGTIAAIPHHRLYLELFMPRRHLSLPSHYSNLLGRVTLAALLLAGGSGVAWDLVHTPGSELRGFNEQLIAANDVLLDRALHAGSGAGMAHMQAPPGTDGALVAQR
jgi:hypothetical protein